MPESLPTLGSGGGRAAGGGSWWFGCLASG
jgi:hypothetical protein